MPIEKFTVIICWCLVDSYWLGFLRYLCADFCVGFIWFCLLNFGVIACPIYSPLYEKKFINWWLMGIFWYLKLWNKCHWFQFLFKWGCEYIIIKDKSKKTCISNTLFLPPFGIFQLLQMARTCYNPSYNVEVLRSCGRCHNIKPHWKSQWQYSQKHSPPCNHYPSYMW